MDRCSDDVDKEVRQMLERCNRGESLDVDRFWFLAQLSVMVNAASSTAELLGNLELTRLEESDR